MSYFAEYFHLEEEFINNYLDIIDEFDIHEFDYIS